VRVVVRCVSYRSTDSKTKSKFVFRVSKKSKFVYKKKSLKKVSQSIRSTFFNSKSTSQNSNLLFILQQLNLHNIQTKSELTLNK
jgi:hypothetical protein